jgi:PAS domain S-box-containing protein
VSLSVRLSIAMVALVLLTATAVGLLGYRNLEEAILPRALERVEGHTRLLASELESYARGARSDILGFGSAVALTGIVRARFAGGTDPLDGTSEKTWRDRMAARYAAELASKPAYDQFRVIGAANDGREIVRVDRSGPDRAIRIVPEDELQTKADRDFFRQTAAIAPGEVYVSQIDLTQNRGVIATPHVPTLRVATPVHAQDGTLFGIVVINVDMRPIFEKLRALARAGGQLFIVNERGDYLLHPESNKAFGFEFGRPVRWQDDFPGFAQAVGSETESVRIVPDAAGERGTAALAMTSLAGGPRVGVIEMVPNAVIMAPLASLRQSTLTAAAGAALVAALLAILLARSLTRPLIQMTKAVAGFAEGRPTIVPTEAGGEIGVLARAFSSMASDVRDKNAALTHEISRRRRFFETTVDLILVVDRQGNFVEVSPSSVAIIGRKPEEMVGQSGVAFVHPDDLESTRSEMRTARQGRHVSNFDCRYLHADGRAVLLQWTGVWSEVEQEHYFIGRDITARKAAEDALRRYAEREQLFIAAVESSHDAIITKALDGTVTGWNHAAEQLFGYTAQEAIGQSIYVIVPAERHEEVSDILVRLGRGEYIDHHETVRIAKDGRRLDISLSVSPVKSTSGELIGAAKVARDITAAKRAQEAFQREVEGRRRLFEILSNTITSIVDAVLVSDANGRIVHSNPAAARLMGIVAGLDPADWIKPNEVRLPGEDEPIPLHQRPLMRAVRGELVENVEMVVHHKTENKTYSLIANGSPIRDTDGGIAGAVVVYRDVTQAKETERQLRQAQKMEAVGELTGGIAHDFNNVLTVITGTIEILADGVADKPELKTIAKMINDAAMRGGDLTQRLLAFARKQPLQPGVIDVNELVADTAKLLRPTLGEHVHLETLLKHGIPKALVDPNQLTTALLNLALNSRDAMPKGGSLIIETSHVHLDEAYAGANSDVQSGPYVLIAVSDTGSGIPADIQEKVFEPFFTTKDVGRGTGLGLSMVYGFVKQSGGHIKIYSEAGHGTTIKVYLPIADGQETSLENASAAPPVGGTETILAVEDDPLVRASVVTQLESLGYAVLTAGNAAEALETIDNGSDVDVLFTDVIMPGFMNGRQLAEEAQKRRSGLKVLFTSGYTENAFAHHGRLDPGVVLLAKPYRKEDLARMLRQVIG